MELQSGGRATKWDPRKVTNNDMNSNYMQAVYSSHMWRDVLIRKTKERT